jgi:uncharacterized lipoprotein YmbA
MRSTPLRLVLVACTTVMVAACIHSSPASRFYTLQADIPAQDAGTVAIGEGWVGVGPIGIPSYLDRPQIVTRGEGHRLVVNEFDRWAEPVKARILSVLMENVVILSTSKRVTPYPWSAEFRPERRVAGEIAAFEAAPSGEVVLRVRWVVQAPGKAEEAAVHTGEYREDAAPGDFDAVVGAMSKALARWSRDIAMALAEWKPAAGE